MLRDYDDDVCRSVGRSVGWLGANTMGTFAFATDINNSCAVCDTGSSWNMCWITGSVESFG